MASNCYTLSGLALAHEFEGAGDDIQQYDRQCLVVGDVALSDVCGAWRFGHWKWCWRAGVAKHKKFLHVVPPIGGQEMLDEKESHAPQRKNNAYFSFHAASGHRTTGWPASPGP